MENDNTAENENQDLNQDVIVDRDEGLAKWEHERIIIHRNIRYTFVR